MLDTLRTSLFRAITTPRGDAITPLRVQKDLARRLNVLLGSPLCSPEDLAKRRAAEVRLAALRTASKPTARKREPAPVMIYFEADRNARMLGRIKETLDARAIPYTLLDVAGDEATMQFVTRSAKCEEDDLPIVFIAGTPVGGFQAVVDWDVSGALAKAVFGENGAAS
jgi:hypothetical protein